MKPTIMQELEKNVFQYRNETIVTHEWDIKLIISATAKKCLEEIYGMEVSDYGLNPETFNTLDLIRIEDKIKQIITKHFGDGE